MRPICNIVIANYNYEKWIADAINSAKNQSYKEIIISVVDDFSTDNSIQVALKTLEIDSDPIETEMYTLWIKDNRQLFRLKKNSGPSTARNVAIAYNLDNASFFSALDADDYIADNKIEVLINEIEKFRGVGCIYADYYIVNVNNNNSSNYEYKRTYGFKKLLNECIVHSGSLFTKESILSTAEDTGFYDYRIKGPEDYDLWLRIAERFMILHYPEPLTYVRATGINISNTAISGNSENYKKGFEILNRKLQERNARNTTAR